MLFINKCARNLKVHNHILPHKLSAWFCPQRREGVINLPWLHDKRKKIHSRDKYKLSLPLPLTSKQIVAEAMKILPSLFSLTRESLVLLFRITYFSNRAMHLNNGNKKPECFYQFKPNQTSKSTHMTYCRWGPHADCLASFDDIWFLCT